MGRSDLAILISARDQASSVLAKVGQGLRGLGQAASIPGKAIGGLTDALGKIGLAGLGIQAVTGAAKGLGDALGIGLLNEMEQVSASIQAFTKDEKETARILAMVREEANKTPFAFREMANATAALMPVSKQAKIGLMDLVKQAEILAASNPMQGLEGASFALREAMTGDFTSIIERFNLSRSTLNKLKAEGVPAFKAIQIAMKEMGFDADLVAAKAQTMEGRWSTFNDTIDTLKMRMSQPIFDALKEGLMSLQGFLDANMDSLEGFADFIAGAFTGAITSVKAIFAAFKTDAGAMGIVMDQIRKVFGDAAADALEPFINAIMKAIPQVKTMAKELNVLFELFLGGKFKLIKTVIAAFSGDIDVLEANMMEMRKTFGDATINGIEPFVMAIKDAGPEIRSFAKDVSEKLQGVLIETKLEFHLLKLAAKDLNTELEQRDVIDNFANTARGLSIATKDAAGEQINWGEILRQFAPVLRTASGDTYVLGVSMLGLARTIDLVSRLVLGARYFFENLMQPIRLIGSELQKIIPIIEAFGSQVFAAASEVGANLINGIVGGIRRGWGRVTGTLQNLAQESILTTDNVFETRSPSKVFERIGRQIAEGLGIGIEKDTFKATDSLKELGEIIVKLAREQLELAPKAVDFLAGAFRRLATDSGISAGGLEKITRALRDFQTVSGTVEAQSKKVKGLEELERIRKLWASPEALQFQQRANDLEEAQLDLQQQMLPLLRAREAIARRLQEAQEVLRDAEASENAQRIKAASRIVDALEREARAADEGLRPWQESVRIIEEQQQELRLAEQQWQNQQRAIAANAEQAEILERKLEEVFRAQQRQLEQQMENFEQLKDRIDDAKEEVKNLGDAIEELPPIPEGVRFDLPNAPAARSAAASLPVAQSPISITIQGGNWLGTAEQAAQLIRDELLKTMRRNATLAFT